MNVYVDGTFDLLHTGHLKFLMKAKTFGSSLIVGVISDKNVESYKRRPVIPCEQRSKMVGALRVVDRVIENCPLNYIEPGFLNLHEIGCVVYGGDPGAGVEGEDLGPWTAHYQSAIDRGILKRVSYSLDENSSTQIIQKIVELDFTQLD